MADTPPVGHLSLTAKLYIAAVVISGLASFTHGVANWACADIGRFVCYLMIAVVASGLKVSLPGITGTMSVNYVFILLGMMELSLSETLVLACAAITVQTGWRATSRIKPIHLIFNWSSMANAATAGYLLHHHLDRGGHLLLLSIVSAASAFFLVNTLSIAGVVSLTERKALRKTWQECYFWSFPYYLVGAAIAALVHISTRYVGWQTPIFVLPVVYTIYRSYRLYLGKLESEKDHAEQMAALHLRTIEALALAIEAKDDTTHGHLKRVQVYAVEMGRRLGLEGPELQALRAASILHDIGKLAVPEHIISKPGKLTPEEFEKMKIHPVVGSEILARVEFPYPVVPIVRAHHERWNGTGYPDGLKEEQIPIGARILSAVDCLDALASDRQYRRALPLDEAMAFVVGEAGKNFDPRVVMVLEQNYRELERLASARPVEPAKLSKDLKIARGEAPGAGLEKVDHRDVARPDFLASIAAARQEVQMLYELTQELGNSLSLHETLSVLDSRLKRLIPYDAIAVYILRNDVLFPEYVNGENFRLFSSLEIPMGQGLAGWVAETGDPIINGNPSVEPGYLNDPTKFSSLRSALAVPLKNALGVTGVLALYHADRDAFSKDHLRILQAVDPKMSLAIENALKYRQAEISATTDGLTGLPNARSLFLHLDAELARSKRSNSGLVVLVCDLDGFKQINDRFGHLEGNRVLVQVSAGMREICREYDYVARMGGDEFVLILSSFQAQDLPVKIDKLSRLVEDAGFSVCGERLLAVSVGAAFYPRHGDNAEQLLAEADRCMYLVKQRHKGVPVETNCDPELLELSKAIAGVNE
jgi:diguanylate cyclase (GGDEF)-like protein/putative nucleotidyltransferase with HDIG domain